MGEVVNVLFLLANLAVLGFNLKLYTEVLKDNSQNRRADRARSLPTPDEQRASMEGGR